MSKRYKLGAHDLQRFSEMGNASLLQMIDAHTKELIGRKFKIEKPFWITREHGATLWGSWEHEREEIHVVESASWSQKNGWTVSIKNWSSHKFPINHLKFIFDPEA